MARYRLTLLAIFLSLTFLMGVMLSVVKSASIPQVAAVELSKTVGTDMGVCAATDVITITAVTEVTYCYHVFNTGDVTLSLHSLVDSEFGILLQEDPSLLLPGEDRVLMQTAVIEHSTVNTATWTAWTDGMVEMAESSDTAVVHVYTPLHNVRNVALIGEMGQVQQTAAPFIDAGQIRLLREYPNVLAYLREAPEQYFTILPPNPVIQLFTFTVPNEEAMQVLEEIVMVAQTNNVAVEDSRFEWLSSTPGYVLAVGECLALDQEINTVPSIGEPVIVDLSIQDAGFCDTNIQIRQYPIISEEPVMDVVTHINDVALTVIAQPNRFLVGNTSQDYIAGSPAGPLAAPAQPWSIAPSNLTGQDVRVLVFDTTPFSLTVGAVQQESFHGVPITVSYPFPLPPDLPIGGQSIAAHGSFVSGAVVDVAPEAQVHLIQVLNDSAIGDEFTFYQAAQQAISQTLMVSDTLAGMIMNYSFVLEITPTLSAPAMEVFLTAASAHNITQIAAAGNDSAVTSQPFPMLFPAKHDKVVGITAVTWDTNAISCFANEGEVAIFGGGIARGNSCDTAEIIDQCVSGGHPEYCVTGWDPNSPTEYAYGLGTSFSAPLVAGLAAQDIEMESSALGSWPASSVVRDRIYDRVTHNPAPASITIGAIGTPYAIKFLIYQPFVTRN